ncbi:MAG: hypothetical protein ABII02_01455 [Candidatus Magasanikbacteria bacterium]
MFILIIISSGIIIGLLAGLMKKRFSTWIYFLIAFLGALIGAGLSFGDSALFLAYPIFNIWTVPASFAILFSLVTIFVDRGNMKTAIASIILILAAIAGFVYMDSSPSDYSGIFRKELTRTGVERVSQPIEGFNALIYLEAFPGFEESDFDGAKTLEGIYKIEDGELKYERTVGNPVTSAEETISDEGYRTLLQNFSHRAGVEVGTETDISTLLEKLYEGDIEQNSYIHDDFSIWSPDGWYPYENGPSVFFAHDANLEIPQNTEGFALGPYFQVTVYEISLDEMFTQNLWTEGSEFLISRDDVHIGTEDAIRVVTKAAGAGGEVLHYVFEATDGRVFMLSHYPYERGSSDTDDFERALQSFVINYVINRADYSQTPAIISEDEARSIALNSCINGGGALASGGTYNENSKTWWFDANLITTQEGCNPACVVSEETKTAEINWRCTGLKQ